MTANRDRGLTWGTLSLFATTAKDNEAMKHVMMTLVGLMVALPAIAQDGVYMGKASTGEAVYYLGAKAQCGDLPRSHACWKNPMISYKIGNDYVSAIPDCKRGIFKEAWVGDRKVAINMKPQSEAIRLVLRTGCNSVR